MNGYPLLIFNRDALIDGKSPCYQARREIGPPSASAAFPGASTTVQRGPDAGAMFDEASRQLFIMFTTEL